MVKIELTKLLAGLVSARSEQWFMVTGKGARNQGSPHRICVFAFECCDKYRGERGHLSAIANGGREPRADLTLAIGEQIEIDGRVYEIFAQRWADPLLAPIGA